MPQKTVNLDQIQPNLSINLVYLAKYKDGTSLNYLQSIRSGTYEIVSKENPEDNLFAQSYNNNLPHATKSLAQNLEEYKFDIILRPPSSREDAKPYLEKIKEIRPDIKEISDCINRTKGSKSGVGNTFKQYRKSLSYSCESTPNGSIKLLIVDDVFNSGRTVSSILDLLINESFSLDGVTVACPLLIEDSSV
ncbi:hypothetical protein [Fodinibius sp.]|uniref:hypothetical protein n=1 Tax=Fodinibius sp. TaxID=1872440 RepID=UPI002ACE96AF|nr:hypothetical protein [Fodinibius sp.]MDZ7660066.1 hypothetical protein [Fodinibius sp.]